MKYHPSEKIKNFFYKLVLVTAQWYWKIFKPVTYGARILVVTETEILLVQARLSSVWNLPGGGIKRNEKPSAAALRELKEELGVDYNSIDYQLGEYYSKHEGKKDTIFIFVKKIVKKDEMDLEIEIQKAQWFAFENLPDTIGGSTKLRINEYQSGLKNLNQSW